MNVLVSEKCIDIHSFPVICAWDFINIDVIHPTATADEAMCIAAVHSIALSKSSKERENERARMGRTRSSSGNLINWHQIRLVIGTVPLLLRMG